MVLERRKSGFSLGYLVRLCLEKTQTDRQTDMGGRVRGLPVQRFFNIGLALNIITNQAKSYRFPLPAHTCSLPSIFSPQETKGVYLKGKRTYTEKEKSQYSGGGG